jgi:hypothetical protein
LSKNNSNTNSSGSGSKPRINAGVRANAAAAKAEASTSPETTTSVKAANNTQKIEAKETMAIEPVTSPGKFYIFCCGCNLLYRLPCAAGTVMATLLPYNANLTMKAPGGGPIIENTPLSTPSEASTTPLGGASDESPALIRPPQAGFIGAYSPESRRERVERFLEKRNRRVWTKKVKYDVRKNFADSRLRVKVCVFALWPQSI